MLRLRILRNSISASSLTTGTTTTTSRVFGRTRGQVSIMNMSSQPLNEDEHEHEQFYSNYNHNRNNSNQDSNLRLHPLYPKLFTPYDLGDDIGLLPNRILMGSMHTGLEGHSMPSIMESMLNFWDKEDNDKQSHSHDTLDRMAMYFRRRAQGGVGLMVTGGIAPNYEGWVGPFAAKLTSEQEMEKHKIVTEAVHSIQVPIYGSSNTCDNGPTSVQSKIILQILHTGRYAYHPFAVSAENKKSPISPFAPKSLTTEGVHNTVNDFVTTASLAKKAGYDGVEIMGSEGYLISQFLSPATNSTQRTDEYGGVSFTNRSRFPLEIVRAVRQQCGNNFIIIFRISLWELVENGMSWEETVQLSQELKSAGVTILNTGIGWHESRIPTIASNVPRGAFTAPTKQLKEQLLLKQEKDTTSNSVPAIVSTNRVNAPDTIEKILHDDTSDLVSMARPLLADPDFIQKAWHEEPNSINTCIACNQACLDHAFVGKTASCLVNPIACHELEFLELEQESQQENSKDNKSKKDDDVGIINSDRGSSTTLTLENRLKLGVVGAGPAGIAFACTAAELGHTVTLYERSHKVGGQFHMAKRVPGKEEFYEAIRYWENRILSSQQQQDNDNNTTLAGSSGTIQVKLNTEMTIDDMTNLTVSVGTTTDDVGTADTFIDKWIVSTGVTPRDPKIPGSEQFPNRVLSYVDVLRHNKPVGKRVAVIGAGGIGFDVSEFLLYANSRENAENDNDTSVAAADVDTCPADTVSIEDFWKEWGVDPKQEYRGGLAKDGPSSPHGQPERSVYLMQRKKGKVGANLGRTTGWIHRASLKNSNKVTNIAGVKSYDKINDDGNLVYTDSNNEQHVLEVDTIVLCAGQLEERTLENGSQNVDILHDKVYPIGGAYKAGELDAKRAIDMGTRLAHKIHLSHVTPGNHVFHSPVGTEEKLFRFLKKWT